MWEIHLMTWHLWPTPPFNRRYKSQNGLTGCKGPLMCTLGVRLTGIFPSPRDFSWRKFLFPGMAEVFNKKNLSGESRPKSELVAVDRCELLVIWWFWGGSLITSPSYGVMEGNLTTKGVTKESNRCCWGNKRSFNVHQENIGMDS